MLIIITSFHDFTALGSQRTAFLTKYCLSLVNFEIGKESKDRDIGYWLYGVLVVWSDSKNINGWYKWILMSAEQNVLSPRTWPHKGRNLGNRVYMKFTFPYGKSIYSFIKQMFFLLA